VQEACDDPLMCHVVIVGGPQTPLVEPAPRKATRWLPKYKNETVQIIIVAPSSLSDGVKRTFASKGCKVEQIMDRFTDVVPETR
jgi:hypothetical protein